MMRCEEADVRTVRRHDHRPAPSVLAARDRALSSVLLLSSFEETRFDFCRHPVRRLSAQRTTCSRPARSTRAVFDGWLRFWGRPRGFEETPGFRAQPPVGSRECAQKPPPKTGVLGKLSGLWGNGSDRLMGFEVRGYTLVGFLGNASSTSVAS